MILLRYLGRGRATVDGVEQRYEWSSHGDVQPVAIPDAAALLLKRRTGGGCCGAPKRDIGPLFEEPSDNSGDEPQEE